MSEQDTTQTGRSIPPPPRRRDDLPPPGPPQRLIRTPGWSLFGRYASELEEDQSTVKKAASDRKAAST